MKMKQIFGLVAAAALSTPTFAITYGVGGGASLQGVLDGITVGGSSSVDVTTDYMSDNNDSWWSVSGSGGAVSTIIIELAGFANQNKFGVYDRTDSSKKVEIFNGVAGAGDQALLSIKADGSVHISFADTGIDFASNAFGFYLDSSANVGGGVFYSDTLLNTDQVDHLAVFQGTDTDTVQTPGNAPGTWTSNEFILAWEDLYNGGDRDYTDFVVMIESINPVPAPATLALLGLGLLGMGAAARRRKA